MRKPEEIARAIALLELLQRHPPPKELTFLKPLALALTEALRWASGEETKFPDLLNEFEAIHRKYEEKRRTNE